MNVLILSGRFGMGHNSAAQALKEELINIDEKINVDIVDLLGYIYPGTNEIIYKAFDRVVNKHHEIYNMIYKASEKLEMDMKLSGNGINKKIGNLIAQHRPSMIISTLPLCARTLSAYKDITGLEIPIVTCVTDISMHSEWITPNTDIYLVPTKKIKENLIYNQIDEGKIFVTGIPVKQEFKKDKEIREVEDKNILIMGGGLGLLPDLDGIMEKLQGIENLSTTIITGKNKKLYDELQGKYRNTEVVGFTNRVSDYMARADFMISKAGGITLFESIYSETPMFVITPFLEQEKENARFIEENLIGEIVWDKKEDFSETLFQLIEDGLKVQGMRNNIKSLKDKVIEEDLYKVLKDLCKEYVA